MKLVAVLVILAGLASVAAGIATLNVTAGLIVGGVAVTAFGAVGIKVDE